MNTGVVGGADLLSRPFIATRSSDKGRAAGATLMADEANFLDLPNCSVWLNYEYPQVNPSPENIVATEQSGLVKLYFQLRHRADLSRRCSALLAHPSWHDHPPSSG